MSASGRSRPGNGFPVSHPLEPSGDHRRHEATGTADAQHRATRAHCICSLSPQAGSLIWATTSHTTVILGPHPRADSSIIYNIIFFKSIHLCACLLCHTRRGALSQECLIVPLRTGDFPSVCSHMCISPRLPPPCPHQESRCINNT